MTLSFIAHTDDVHLRSDPHAITTLPSRRNATPVTHRTSEGHQAFVQCVQHIISEPLAVAKARESCLSDL